MTARTCLRAPSARATLFAIEEKRDKRTFGRSAEHRHYGAFTEERRRSPMRSIW